MTQSVKRTKSRKIHEGRFKLVHVTCDDVNSEDLYTKHIADIVHEASDSNEAMDISQVDVTMSNLVVENDDCVPMDYEPSKVDDNFNESSKVFNLIRLHPVMKADSTSNHCSLANLKKGQRIRKKN